MEILKIDGTDRSPEVEFDFSACKFRLKGESYPEDVTAFYNPILEKLSHCLETASGKEVEFNFELIYFNSSSAKIIMGIFDQLEEAAAAGADVVINWHFDAEDDTMEELGGELAEDLIVAKFNMIKLDS